MTIIIIITIITDTSKKKTIITDTLNILSTVSKYKPSLAHPPVKRTPFTNSSFCSECKNVLKYHNKHF
jgi:hypothetical protein